MAVSGESPAWHRATLDPTVLSEINAMILPPTCENLSRLSHLFPVIALAHSSAQHLPAWTNEEMIAAVTVRSKADYRYTSSDISCVTTSARRKKKKKRDQFINVQGIYCP